eukprot:s2451_g2.t1
MASQPTLTELEDEVCGSMEALFADLRDDSRPGWKDEVYTILAIDEQGQQIHLDKAVQTKFDSAWMHDQHLISITSVSEDVCTVSSLADLAVGDELTQRYFLTDTNDILQQALTDHWKPRWNIMASLQESDWQRVIGFTRHYMPQRFDVAVCLGDEVSSTSGLPEGCPLSILAMLTVDWCYHVYMRAFCPRVIAYSFVDNLTLAAPDAMMVVQALFTLQTVCLLFGLSTDDDKTYVWGLTKRSRDAIGRLGFPCFSDASELGGDMAFGASRRTRVLRQRGQQLHPKWQRLRRSMAPDLSSWQVCPWFFWPKAFHGSAGCLIADNYAHDLRKEAVKAVKLNGAGSNPFLRLSLPDNMKADPEFFHLQLCVATFRRMLRKNADLLHMRQIWHRQYDGPAWGVVDASNQQVIATAHLAGIVQSIDRAELTALLAALRWPTGTELALCIWSDSLSTIQVAEYIQKFQCLSGGVANEDLWQNLLRALQDRLGLDTSFRWVPSHLPLDAGEDPFEDWVIRWNDAADRLACHTNRTRPPSFWRFYHGVKTVLDGWATRLRQLRQFYFLVADLGNQQAQTDANIPVVESSDNDPDWL